MLWLIFFDSNYSAKSGKGIIPLNICMKMTCDSHTNAIQELQIFMIPIPTLIPLGLIPILIPIPGFTKIYDSNSNSSS